MNPADWLILGTLLTVAATGSALVWAVLTDRWWAAQLAGVLKWVLGVFGVLFLAVGCWLLLLGGAA